MRHLICFENSTDGNNTIDSLDSVSPFLGLINARNAYDVMTCAEILGTYGLDTYSPIKDLTTEELNDELLSPNPTLLTEELHGSNPTRAQISAVERAVRKWGNSITTHITIPVVDFYSVSVLLRAALVLDSFARNRCPHEPSLAAYERPHGFRVETRLGPGGHGELLERLFESFAQPFSCGVDYSQSETWVYDAQENEIIARAVAHDRYDRSPGKYNELLSDGGLRYVLEGAGALGINSEIGGSGQDAKRKAAQNLADDIFSLYLAGLNQQRANGRTYSYCYHDLCGKYAELARLCEDNRIGVCAKCGKVFISDKTRGKQRIYCSDSCRVTKWQNTHLKEPSGTLRA